MDMRPAYLGDAAVGDTIRFRLPATGGGTEQFEGVLWSYDKQTHAVAAKPFVEFLLSGHVARGPFRCGVNLHIDLARKAHP